MAAMTTGPENPYGEQEPVSRRPAALRCPAAALALAVRRAAAALPAGAGAVLAAGLRQPYQQPGYGQPVPYVTAPPTDGLALGSMITGIVALVLSCAYGVGLLASPVALVLGKVSMNRIARSQGQLGGRGLAVTGFVLGIVGTVLLVIAIAIVVVVIIVAVNDPDAFNDGYSSSARLSG